MEVNPMLMTHKKKQVEEPSSSDTYITSIHTRQLLACFMDYINLGKFSKLITFKEVYMSIHGVVMHYHIATYNYHCPHNIKSL
jgi:hypothetical protein